MPTINSKFYIKSSESPIFLKSYEALQTVIKRIYGQNLQIVGTLDENDINRELGRTTLDLAKSSYAMITPTNLTDNLESYQSFSLKKYGTEPIKHTDGYYYSFHLKPVKLTCAVSFFSQSFLDILQFMSKWNFNAREGTFKLTTKQGLSFDIHVSLEADLNFPSKDFSQGNPLKVLTAITLDTYVGEIYKSPELKFIKPSIKLVTVEDFDTDEDLNLKFTKSSCNEVLNATSLTIDKNGLYKPKSPYNGFNQVSVEVNSVNNQDLVITRNGSYLPSSPYTGFGSINVNVPSSGSGKIISATNKTNSAINKSDKVWINHNSYLPGSSYIAFNQSLGYGLNGILSPSGNFAWISSGLYNISSTSATRIGDFLAYGQNMKYMANDSIFKNSSRIDEIKQYSLDPINDGYRPINENYFYNSNVAENKIYNINIDSGDIENIYTCENTLSNIASWVKVKDFFYKLGNRSSTKKYLLNEDTSTLIESDFEWVGGLSQGIAYTLGVTQDAKYIIAGTYTGTQIGTNLRIIEYIKENQLRILSANEMPEDLQRFYSNRVANITFNPYTGILALCTSNTQDYVIMQYKEGQWIKLSIDLNLPQEAYFFGYITLSKDLSRALYTYGTSSSNYWFQNIVNLSSFEGNIAVPYQTYNINKDTLTGYALENCEPNAIFSASVASEN